MIINIGEIGVIPFLLSYDMDRQLYYIALYYLMLSLFVCTQSLQLMHNYNCCIILSKAFQGRELENLHRIFYVMKYCYNQLALI